MGSEPRILTPWHEDPDPVCWRCDGEGGTFGVYGQLDTYAECPACNGTGAAEPDPPTPEEQE